MKDFDNCSQNKISDFINYIYYCSLIFKEIYVIYSLIKYCFYFCRKNKFIVITFVLQDADKKNKIPII